MGIRMTRFRRTTWLLAFMVMTFSMFGGPASMLCLGCDRVAVELGSCCCDGTDECGEEPRNNGNNGSNSPSAPNSCDICVDLVFHLEEAPVVKISHDPAPAMVVVDLPVVDFASPTVTVSACTSSRRPPDFSPPLRLLRTMRLLI
jgi:hypothetical protein